MSQKCCESKIKYRKEEDKKRLMNRLSRIEGQVRGVRSMVEKDAYCTDILLQVTAICSALEAFQKELLGEHIRTCVIQDIRDGKDETAEELIETLRRMK